MATVKIKRTYTYLHSTLNGKKAHKRHRYFIHTRRTHAHMAYFLLYNTCTAHTYTYILELDTIQAYMGTLVRNLYE